MKTYDILNAGPKNRFMANGKIVSNSGRTIQLQNLVRNSLSTLDEARELVKVGAFDLLEVLYKSAPDVLSQLIRTMLIPKPGHEFVVADFSAIEARVLAWLAGEQWVLDAFRRNEDLYCAVASRMFNKPVIKHGLNSELRQYGKIATLACIAEGQMVLTDQGLVPIQNVTKSMKLWDGKEWITHDGVIYRGERNVITYEGLTATPDHVVYIEGNERPIQFSFAASSGAHLIQTGNGRQAIRLGENNQRCKKSCRDEKKKLEEHTKKVRVYDILNAGQHHRFTVSEKLVHNCGYGGGVGALNAFGATDMGVKEEELQGIIDDWRNANPNIVKFWWDIDSAVKKTVKIDHKRRTCQRIKIDYYDGILWLVLPSGRSLAYFNPEITINRFGGESIGYQGTDATNKWTTIETYGGKYAENVTQATARDLLAEAMLRAEKAGLNIVCHVHDEMVLEVPENTVSVEDVCNIMNEAPDWAEGLPLASAGYKGKYYFKD